ncbi:unnamed protein product [Polarella glacialis]|uniref:Uncharacterized protein n=1 Tax=Polarella glacialis TaxID=89957 RepID=A0A813HPE0_POLGL|nr:unnamed protein product [Polarella glacialis]
MCHVWHSCSISKEWRPGLQKDTRPGPDLATGYVKERQSERLSLCGGGWAMHFRNPDKPLRPVGEDDLREVVEFLKETEGLAASTIKQSTMEVIQADLGFGKKQGNLQLYTTKFGRSVGNFRLNVGEEDKVRGIRAILLKSLWFIDCPPGTSEQSNKQLDLVHQPDGKLILPPLTTTNKPASLEKLFKDIKKNLGAKGKAAMAAYMTKCKLPVESEASRLLDKAFGVKEPRPGAGGRP